MSEETTNRNTAVERRVAFGHQPKLEAGWQPTTPEVRGYQPSASGQPEGKNPPTAVSSVVPAPQSAAPKEKS